MASGVLNPKLVALSPHWRSGRYPSSWKCGRNTPHSPRSGCQSSPEAIRGERAGAGELTSPGVLAPKSTDVSRWPRGLPTRHAGFVLTVRPLYQLIKLTF